MGNKKKMTPKEKGQFLLKHFRNEEGGLDLNNVDLSDFKGDVDINGWKVGGSLFQDCQEVKGDLHQCNQKAGRNLYQDEQVAGGCIIQDGQEAGGRIVQDEQEAEDGCKCVEPNYKAEYEKMKKELCEADKKIETLMWALRKAMEASNER